MFFFSLYLFGRNSLVVFIMRILGLDEWETIKHPSTHQIAGVIIIIIIVMSRYQHGYF